MSSISSVEGALVTSLDRLPISAVVYGSRQDQSSSGSLNIGAIGCAPKQFGILLVMFVIFDNLFIFIMSSPSEAVVWSWV